MDALTDYGYPLLRPSLNVAPETVLMELLAQHDVRFLEGFPVVVAHMLKEKTLTWERKQWTPAGLPRLVAARLAVLFPLTYQLFKLFGLERALQQRVHKLALKCSLKGDLWVNLQKKFLESLPVKLDGVELSTVRLTRNFRNYVVHSPQQEAVEQQKYSLERELLLSYLFTPRQKELLRKRLKRQSMTKTEQEYFYRVVKKRLKALADDKLHEMAKQLV